jgi:hypothetical protein
MIKSLFRGGILIGSADVYKGRRVSGRRVCRCMVVYLFGPRNMSSVLENEGKNKRKKRQRS